MAYYLFDKGTLDNLGEIAQKPWASELERVGNSLRLKEPFRNTLSDSYIGPLVINFQTSQYPYFIQTTDHPYTYPSIRNLLCDIKTITQSEKVYSSVDGTTQSLTEVIFEFA